jgi:hypothetical protein
MKVYFIQPFWLNFDKTGRFEYYTLDEINRRFNIYLHSNGPIESLGLSSKEPLFLTET